jgi:hypothetical protein
MENEIPGHFQGKFRIFKGTFGNGRELLCTNNHRIIMPEINNRQQSRQDVPTSRTKNPGHFTTFEIPVHFQYVLKFQDAVGTLCLQFESTDSEHVDESPTGP